MFISFLGKAYPCIISNCALFISSIMMNFLNFTRILLGLLCVCMQLKSVSKPNYCLICNEDNKNNILPEYFYFTVNMLKILNFHLC